MTGCPWNLNFKGQDGPPSGAAFHRYVVPPRVNGRVRTRDRWTRQRVAMEKLQLGNLMTGALQFDAFEI